MKKLIIYILPLIFVFWGCNKTVEPDLCAAKSSTTADFDVYESYVTEADRKDPLCVGCKYWVNYVTDTLMTNYVTFIAKQDSTKGVKYEWRIGRVTSDKKKITVHFSNRQAGNDVIPITLKVTNPYPSACYPMDDGKREFTKNIVLLTSKMLEDAGLGTSFGSKSKLNGTYVGTYWNIEFPFDSDSIPNKKTYEGDTMVIKMGWNRVNKSGCFSIRNTQWYILSYFKRNKIESIQVPGCFPEYAFNEKYWRALDDLGGALGYKQYESDNDYKGRNVRLVDGNNIIEFRVRGKLIFKGTRI